MKKKWIYVGIVVALGLTVGAMVLYSPDSVENIDVSSEPKVFVASTLYPMHALVTQIGGARVSSKLLLAETNPPSAIQNVYQAIEPGDWEIIFAFGHGLDTTDRSGFSEKFFIPDEGVNLMLREGTTADPYYWLSLEETRTVIKNIVAELSRIDPEGAALYQVNGGKLESQIVVLDQTIDALFSELKFRTIITAGTEIQYFARDYGLDIVYSLPAGSADTDSLAGLSRVVQEYAVPVIFTDIFIGPSEIAPILFKHTISSRALDILGGIEGRVSYVDLMSDLARAIFDELAVSTSGLLSEPDTE